MLAIQLERRGQRELQLAEALVGLQDVAELGPGLLHVALLVLLHDVGPEPRGRAVARVVVELVDPAGVAHGELFDRGVPLSVERQTDDRIGMGVGVVFRLAQGKLEVDRSLEVEQEAARRSRRRVAEVGRGWRPLFGSGDGFRAFQSALEAHDRERPSHAVHFGPRRPNVHIANADPRVDRPRFEQVDEEFEIAAVAGLEIPAVVDRVVGLAGTPRRCQRVGRRDGLAEASPPAVLERRDQQGVVRRVRA